MLVIARELIVALDLVFGFRIGLHQVVADVPRQIRQPHPPASKSECVVDQHHVPASGQFVRPSHAPVVLFLVPHHRRMRVLGYSRNFSQPEVLVSAMVVQAHNAR